MSDTRIQAVVPLELKRKAQIRAREVDKTLGEYIAVLIQKDLHESGFDQRYTPAVKPNGD